MRYAKNKRMLVMIRAIVYVFLTEDRAGKTLILTYPCGFLKMNYMNKIEYNRVECTLASGNVDPEQDHTSTVCVATMIPSGGAELAMVTVSCILLLLNLSAAFFSESLCNKWVFMEGTKT